MDRITLGIIAIVIVLIIAGFVAISILGEREIPVREPREIPERNRTIEPPNSSEKIIEFSIPKSVNLTAERILRQMSRNFSDRLVFIFYHPNGSVHKWHSNPPNWDRLQPPENRRITFEREGEQYRQTGLFECFNFTEAYCLWKEFKISF